MISKKDWIKYFPYKKPRSQQVEAINSILNAFNSDKKYFALEAGTGVGKSAIAATVAQYMIHNSLVGEDYELGAIFVTTQKLLQDQYEKDFTKSGMKSIKSASNYKCKYKKFNNCSDGQAEIKLQERGSSYWNVCTFNCNYKLAKEEFIKSHLSVTNFPYLLTETNFNGKIKPRQLLVIDEAHNVATELSKFIEISVTERFTKQVLKINLPSLTTHHQAFEWVKDVYYPKLHSYMKHVEKTLEKYNKLQEKLTQFVSLTRQLQMMKGHLQRITHFLEVYSKENWVFELQKSNIQGLSKLSFKPIDVSQYSHQYLLRMGFKVLFMSATLIDANKFHEMIGVDKLKSDELFLSSPFPVKNRPILYVPIGRMTSKEIDNSLPILAAAIKKILDEHKNDKGIIHTHSYKIANYLKNSIKSRRILVPDSSNRDEVLQKHINSKKPTVLISPSMTEGVDLEGDASRFQVLCKVPYPFLGDKLVKKRMNKWKWWYSFQTTKTIIQSVGRSIRSQEDTAVTYILDADWERFYRINKDLFPSSFRACLK
jgi:ATP-dependent DNA helicase DinG